MVPFTYKHFKILFINLTWVHISPKQTLFLPHSHLLTGDSTVFYWDNTYRQKCWMFELSLSLRFYIKYRRFAIRAERSLSSNTGLQYVQRKKLCFTEHYMLHTPFWQQVAIPHAPDWGSPVPVCQHHHDVQGGQKINEVKEGITVGHTLLFVAYHLLASFLLIICKTKQKM